MNLKKTLKYITLVVFFFNSEDFFQTNFSQNLALVPGKFKPVPNSLRVGDPARLNLLESVVETIEKDDLLKRTRDSGETLMSGLKELQNKYPDYVADPR